MGSEAADAGLAVFAGGDQGNRTQPGGVGQGFQHAGKVGGLIGGDWLAQQWRAARAGHPDAWPVLDAPHTMLAQVTDPDGTRLLVTG